MYSKINFFRDIANNLIKEGNPDKYAVFICVKCKKEFLDPNVAITCNKCSSVIYCCTECKLSDWSYHRHKCGIDKRQCGYVKGADIDQKIS
jgi:hypothetical protein